jgi:hypothetical protein
VDSETGLAPHGAAEAAAGTAALAVLGMNAGGGKTEAAIGSTKPSTTTFAYYLKVTLTHITKMHYLPWALYISAAVLLSLPIFGCFFIGCEPHDGAISISAIIRIKPLSTLYAFWGGVFLTTLTYFQIQVRFKLALAKISFCAPGRSSQKTRAAFPNSVQKGHQSGACHPWQQASRCATVPALWRRAV